MPLEKIPVPRANHLWLLPAFVFWATAVCFVIPSLLLAYPARVLTQLTERCLRWAAKGDAADRATPSAG